MPKFVYCILTSPQFYSNARIYDLLEDSVASGENVDSKDDAADMLLDAGVRLGLGSSGSSRTKKSAHLPTTARAVITASHKIRRGVSRGIEREKDCLCGWFLAENGGKSFGGRRVSR